MSRKHLFAIVVLLGAATVAGLLAISRTTTAAPQTSSAQITAKSRSLDRLEASLRRSLAKRPPALPPTRHAAVSPPPRTIVVRPSAVVRAPTGEREDDHGEEQEHEEADD